MKKLLLFVLTLSLLALTSKAQVTQINNNASLQPAALLNNNLAIVVSGVDKTLWVTDATAGGTFQLSTTIFDSGGVVLNGKYIFAGSTAAEGSEIFITDGTSGGTQIIKDIVPGAASSTSASNGMTLLNGYVYFIAATVAEGSELWRTDGTPGNTNMVADIVPGPTGSNDPGKYNLTSTGTYLLFNVKTVAEGNELWRSDGTIGNAQLLKDIVNGPASSNPTSFYPFSNNILFSVTAADGIHGEIWRTDGTAAGTILLKDNLNAPTLGPISLPFIAAFHVFNGRAYFIVDDGVHASGIWSTDGIDATATHTSFLQDEGITGPNSFVSSVLIVDAFNLPGKFIFPVTDGISRFEFWESDGSTAAGTKLFMSFPANANNNIPFIFVNIGFNSTTRTFTYPLYNGYFFFTANSSAEGNELWKSDGTVAGTSRVTDINPGVGDGVGNGFTSYFYTTSGLYFAANNGTQGNELWKTDGTAAGTTIVKDINLNTSVNNGDADPNIDFIVNSRIMFTATDGDDATKTDLFVVDGIFNPLPVQLLDFTVVQSNNDALLRWSTSQEINSKSFTIQSSADDKNWQSIGTVNAAGNSAVKNNYSFKDIGVANSGKTIVYYKLIITDIDGKTAQSNIIYLKLKGDKNWNVRLLSNPVRENLKVLLEGVSGNVDLSITDMAGHLLYKNKIQNQNSLLTIPVNLSTGMYILTANSNKDKKVIKFIKK